MIWEKECYLASVPIDKHIAAVEVSVDDTRVMHMQVIQPFQNLLGPLFQGPHGHMPVFLPVLPQISTGADLSDEVQSVVLLIPPNTVEGYDVFVGQASEQSHLRVKPFHHCRVITEVPQFHLVPSHLYPLFLIKCPVHLLHSTTSQQFTVSAISSSWINFNKWL